ncbi:hypothetical protein GA0115260_110634 [Streptomyces sp. MnatMP-M27]|uniref:hypothetical protein n=1 Tax=Streptomyces sp. MnatMP-M27 TaxID=1839768 RepID=UPI00081D6F2A|nr:hypothetical protein GA0115260_110634 [Streptomyces sp. MnatMP-M27]
MRVHRVAILALDEVMPLDLAIPAQIFSARETPYQTTVCTFDTKVHTTGGFAVVTDGDLDTYAPLTP